MYNVVKLKNFRVEELVSSHLYQLLGDNSWSLFNGEFLVEVDQFVSDIKEDLGCKSVVINDWLWNGPFTQSGFREANSTTGSKKSQHRQGNALDLKFVGITIDEALDYLIKHQDRYPYIKRYEDLSATRSTNKYGGWLHLDGKLSEPKLRGFYP